MSCTASPAPVLEATAIRRMVEEEWAATERAKVEAGILGMPCSAFEDIDLGHAMRVAARSQEIRERLALRARLVGR